MAAARVTQHARKPVTLRVRKRERSERSKASQEAPDKEASNRTATEAGRRQVPRCACLEQATAHRERVRAVKAIKDRQREKTKPKTREQRSEKADLFVVAHLEAGEVEHRVAALELRSRQAEWIDSKLRGRETDCKRRGWHAGMP